MSRQKFADDCPGCRPVAIDLQTGELCKDDHPMAVALKRVWLKTSRRHKAAFHRVTCLSSRNPVDLGLAGEYMAEVQRAAQEKPDGDQAKPPLHS